MRAWAVVAMLLATFLVAERAYPCTVYQPVEVLRTSFLEGQLRNATGLSKLMPLRRADELPLVPNARLALKRALKGGRVGSVVAQTTSDQAGWFKFTKLPRPGHYFLEVIAKKEQEKLWAQYEVILESATSKHPVHADLLVGFDMCFGYFEMLTKDPIRATKPHIAISVTW